MSPIASLDLQQKKCPAGTSNAAQAVSPGALRVVAYSPAIPARPAATDVAPPGWKAL